MNRLQIRYLAPISLLMLLLGGCLTASHKEMRLSLNPDGKSGSGTILFSHIHSEATEDTTDQTKKDFNSLISEYYQGKKFEMATKGIKNIKKRLYLDGKDLMGEVTFEFDNIADLGFFRYNGRGPFLYYVLSDGYFTSGQFEVSNGSYGGEKMPIIFWDENSRDFYVKVALSSPQSPERSIIPLYQAWVKK